ncbi:MAG: class I SAM-dependent methyltransferase, partial [Anaerolineae bacterium]|nr:class I SAM-dependent methyltransferase [Anaerolineae bacterium]
MLASWVLEHLPDPARVSRKWRRALRPGGALIALAPGGRSPAALLNRALRPLQGWLVPRLYGRAEADAFAVVYRANTRRRVEALARGAGLTLTPSAPSKTRRTSPFTPGLPPERDPGPPRDRARWPSISSPCASSQGV